MKKLLIALLCLALLLAACAAPVQTTDDHYRQPPTMPQADESLSPNDFAFRLAAALLQHSDADENFVLSPYSVWLPLAALVNATQEQYRPVLLQALGVAGMPVPQLNEDTARTLGFLTRRSPIGNGEYNPSPLQIANAVFVHDDLTLLPAFAEMFAQYFNGEALSTDFNNPVQAAAFINQWISDNTHGLIDRVITPNMFDNDTIAVIANAIYFSARWQAQFDPAHTELGTFTAPGGETEAYFMHLESWFDAYYANDYLQAVNLPFNSGGGMMIMLPRNGNATGLLSGMTADEFTRIQDNAARAEGTLQLPRFRIENTLDRLTDALIALGVPLFGGEPLTGGLIAEDLPMWLNSALQAAMIDVDEQGTTAAAVTIMTAFGSAAPQQPDDIFEMICNMPFVFMLHQQGQVLFTGVVNQP